MPVTVKRIRRLVNPTRKRRVSAPAKRRASKRATASKPKARTKSSRSRRNPAVATLGYINPRKRGTSMKRKTTRRKARRKVARRRNPSPTKAIRRGGDVLKTGAFALGGLVLTRQIPQAIFGSRNSGVLGYAMNIATAILAATVVSKFSSKQAGAAVAIGGGLYTVERILSEQLTPLGKALSLSGVGDARAHGGLGAIRRAYMPWPVTRDRRTGKPYIPPEIIEATRAAVQPAPAPQPAPANGGGVGRFAGRF